MLKGECMNLKTEIQIDYHEEKAQRDLALGLISKKEFNEILKEISEARKKLKS
jgi:hypothetical protein